MKNVVHTIFPNVHNIVFMALPSNRPDANGKLKMLSDGPSIQNVLEKMLRAPMVLASSPPVAASVRGAISILEAILEPHDDNFISSKYYADASPFHKQVIERCSYFLVKSVPMKKKKNELFPKNALTYGADAMIHCIEDLCLLDEWKVQIALFLLAIVRCSDPRLYAQLKIICNILFLFDSSHQDGANVNAYVRMMVLPLATG